MVLPSTKTSLLPSVILCHVLVKFISPPSITALCICHVLLLAAVQSLCIGEVLHSVSMQVLRSSHYSNSVILSQKPNVFLFSSSIAH